MCYLFAIRFRIPFVSRSIGRCAMLSNPRSECLIKGFGGWRPWAYVSQSFSIIILASWLSNLGTLQPGDRLRPGLHPVRTLLLKCRKVYPNVRKSK